MGPEEDDNLFGLGGNLRCPSSISLMDRVPLPPEVEPPEVVVVVVSAAACREGESSRGGKRCRRRRGG